MFLFLLGIFGFAAVRSKAVVLLLFIHCLFLLPFFVGFKCMVFVLICIPLCPF